MKPPEWLTKLREAVSGSLPADEVKAVMQKQVERAKEGDVRSAAFVMNQVHKLMDSQAKSAPQMTLQQNNYYDAPRPDKPITPQDSPDEDLRVKRARARAGQPLAQERDRRTRPVSDEEEKELIRRRQAEDDERHRRHLAEE